MKFWKMNGAGNDFIILNNLEEGLPPEAFPRIAKTLCTPHRSLGADGFMVVDQAQGEGDFRMLFFNSDGSVGEMCGNGARCICRYGYETGLSGPVQKVETTAGLVIGERIDRRQYRVRLNDPAVMELGRRLRHHPAFSKGANVNFYDMLGQDHVLEKTYERGVEDFTLACGTGTGSVVTVLTKRGLVSGKQVQVDMPGGTLTVDVEQENDTITGLFLTGPTNLVAKGEIFDEEL